VLSIAATASLIACLEEFGAAPETDIACLGVFHRGNRFPRL